MFSSQKRKIYLQMLKAVAEAIGPDYLDQVVFVGGCTTVLFMDENDAERIRHTEDVDLIVSVTAITGYFNFVEVLKTRGFTTPSPINGGDASVCRLHYGKLKIDLMPTNGCMGFSNIWYEEAFKHAFKYSIDEQTEIKLFPVEYFLATKFEAYKSRGEGDLLVSQDIEDVFNVLYSNSNLLLNLIQSKSDVKSYIANSIEEIQQDYNYDYLLLNMTDGDSDLIEKLSAKIQNIIDLREFN